MAGLMANYLPVKSADYSATQLTIAPQNILQEQVSFNQKSFNFDDESVAILTRSTTPIFKVTVQWDVLTATEANTILDFYCDPLKAKGIARSIEWPHPVDPYTYIVHFWDDSMAREIRYLHSIKQATLKVIGYKAP